MHPNRDRDKNYVAPPITSWYIATWHGRQHMYATYIAHLLLLHVYKVH